jgi:NTE family protein
MESFLSEDQEYNKKPIAGIRLIAKLDLLDNILLPKSGIHINAMYENSSYEWGSSLNYHIYKGSADIFITEKKNTYRISGYYHQGLNDLPKYMTTISKSSKTFTGIKEFQLEGNTLFLSRYEYRYNHKRDIFIHLIGSWLISAKSDEPNTYIKNLMCPGIGITLISPLGPLEFIWSRGPENLYLNKRWRNLFHFSAGYKF